MKHLVIIGARGFGREIFGMAHETDAYLNGEYDFKGFLDDAPHVLDGFPCPYGEYPPILGPVEDYEPQENDVFFCALGDAHVRRKYAQIIVSRGGRFINIILRNSRVSPAAKLGVGVFIGSGCAVSTNVSIGDFTIVHAYTVIGHDVTIGAACTIEPFVFFGGWSKIGDEVTMHVRSSIVPRKCLGDDVVVGVASAVTRNFSKGLHIFGNPAKRLDF